MQFIIQYKDDALISFLLTFHELDGLIGVHLLVSFANAFLDRIFEIFLEIAELILQSSSVYRLGPKLFRWIQQLSIVTVLLLQKIKIVINNPSICTYNYFLYNCVS